MALFGFDLALSILAHLIKGLFVLHSCYDLEQFGKLVQIVGISARTQTHVVQKVALFGL